MAIVKLRDYCLSNQHPRGGYKARVFEASDTLKNALLEVAQAEDAIARERDEYGQRYVLDFVMSGQAGDVRIRSSWIVRSGEDYPRLTSCYVL